MDIKEKLRLVENELQRRRRDNKIDYYNTGEKKHEKQLEFHRCPKRNRWVFGGNRSGKTECGAVECIYLARGNHPFRQIDGTRDGWVVSLSQQVQRDVAQKKLLSYLKKEWIKDIVMREGRKDHPEGGVIDYIDIENCSGGVSRIGFKSCDQGREKFQGASLDFVWFDEEPPKDIFEECRMRILDRKGQIFATMTPLKGLNWVYYDIYQNGIEDEELAVFHMEWGDNPYLDGDEVNAMTKLLTGEALDTRRYGKFSSGQGLVYPEFDERIHVVDPFEIPKEWQDTISIDPGLNNPLSAHWYATDYDGNVYVIFEHFEAGKDVFYHASRIKEICRTLRWKTGYGGRIDALIDSAASQRTLSAVKSVSELFYDAGINVNTRVNKDMFSGINRVKRYLKNGMGRAQLFIFRNCVHLIREFKGYFWGSGENPVKKDDHGLDDLRYFIMTKPEPACPPQAQKSAVLIEKERLIRRLKYGNRL